MACFITACSSPFLNIWLFGIYILYIHIYVYILYILNICKISIYKYTTILVYILKSKHMHLYYILIIYYVNIFYMLYMHTYIRDANFT